jgi:two-component system nitrogen regulation response regulator GlnG
VGRHEIHPGIGETARVELGADELERGNVIELGDRVVLLLHMSGEPRPPVPSLGMVGANEAMDALRRHILRVADLAVPVLVRGETGSGKELVARAVHEASARRDGPFVSVNVAAIPPATAAAELFGHARGAFTGAQQAHLGYFGQAEGGTLFLDEIGSAPADVQPMLLPALDSLEIQPLGAFGPRKVDVRIVAATDADLEQAIAEGSFRAAVYHRLEGYQLFLPPLRRRRDDLGRLLLHFLRDELTQTGELERLTPPSGADSTWLPVALVAQLARLDWPGNVRQLRNVVRQLVISSRGQAQVLVDEPIQRLLEAARGTLPPRVVEAQSLSEEALLEALRAHDYQVGATASALGISRSVLYERVKESGRVRWAKDLSRDELLEAQARCGGDVEAMARQLQVSRRSLGLRLKELGLGD